MGDRVYAFTINSMVGCNKGMNESLSRRVRYLKNRQIDSATCLYHENTLEWNANIVSPIKIIQFNSVHFIEFLTRSFHIDWSSPSTSSSSIVTTLNTCLKCPIAFAFWNVVQPPTHHALLPLSQVNLRWGGEDGYWAGQELKELDFVMHVAFVRFDIQNIEYGNSLHLLDINSSLPDRILPSSNHYYHPW